MLSDVKQIDQSRVKVVNDQIPLSFGVITS